MDWYYARGQEQVGPLSDADFDAARARGEIGPETLVWHDGMPDWIPFGLLSGPASSPGAPAAEFAAALAPCAECGCYFPPADMIEFEGSHVCPACKPLFFQRVEEGANLPGVHVYAGFWIRFLAKMIDSFITGGINFAIQISFLLFVANDWDSAPSAVVSNLIQFLLPIAYSTWFIGAFGATPGKLAVGLRVITPDGGRISYLRAFARCMAEFLSAIIFLIGYIMAAFDEEKRALHDRICNTRVIRVH